MPARQPITSIGTFNILKGPAFMACTPMSELVHPHVLQQGTGEELRQMSIGRVPGQRPAVRLAAILLHSSSKVLDGEAESDGAM